MFVPLLLAVLYRDDIAPPPPPSSPLRPLLSGLKRAVSTRGNIPRARSQTGSLKSSPWIEVDRIERYLPPWEAFVHPKCGLYQDRVGLGFRV